MTAAAHNLIGTDLKAHIEDTVQLCILSKKTDSFEREGDWMDEDDVKQHFKGKPKLIAAALDNARTITDEVTKVTLYEIFKYKSKSVSAEEVEKKNVKLQLFRKIIKNDTKEKK